ncbi:MAG: PAS domain S-box protein, partial [Deltaproteobacteria bacterium]|nr:PAS domain S-box protein [Deltaproteobacteria bacterium]
MAEEGLNAYSRNAGSVQEQKRLIEELEDRESRIRFQAEHSPHAFVFIDRQAAVLFCNRSAQVLFGFAESALVGRLFYDLLPQYFSEVMADAIGAVFDDDRQDTEVRRMKVVCCKHDGEDFFAEIELSRLIIEDKCLCAVTIRDVVAQLTEQSGASANESFLEPALNVAADGIIITNANGYITWGNRAAAAMLGCRIDELQGMHTSELVPETIKDTLYLNQTTSMLNRLFEHGFVESYETLWQRYDGSHCPVEIYSTLIKTESGEVSGTVSSARDISQRKIAEAALRESEERFRALAKSVPEAIVAIDTDGTIVFWNEGAETIFGYGESEVLGRPVSLLVPREKREGDKQAFENMLRSGDSGSVTLQMQGEGLRKDGSIFPDEITRGTWETAQGISYIATIRDITARREAEKKLRISEERLTLCFEATNDALYDWNISNNQVYFNPRYYTMLGYEPYEFKSNFDGWHNLLHPHDAPDVLKQLFDYIEQRSSTYELEFRLRAKSGQWRWVLSRGKVVAWDDDGKPVRMIGTHTDITDRKTAVTQLREALERLKKRENELIMLNRQLVEREDEIRESKDVLENIFSTTADGIIVADSQGRIVNANKAMENILGFQANELVGKYTMQLCLQEEKHLGVGLAMLEQASIDGNVNCLEA